MTVRWALTMGVGTTHFGLDNLSKSCVLPILASKSVWEMVLLCRGHRFPILPVLRDAYHTVQLVSDNSHFWVPHVLSKVSTQHTALALMVCWQEVNVAYQDTKALLL
jgi:hypothetical protein